jgi:hypothetical protein
VRNDFTNKIVNCRNGNCVVGLRDRVLKVNDSLKGVLREWLTTSI